MRKIFYICAVGLLVAACRTAPVYNVESASFVEGLTAEQAKTAIVRGGDKHGWQMRDEGPGEMTGTLSLRAHVAIVSISYDAESFSIIYQDSSNLSYDGTKIHTNYNSWISNLAHSIQASAKTLSGLS
jgi:hypothetical protein